MSRTLTATLIASLMAAQTSEAYYTLLVVSGTGITTKYYVNNDENVTSGVQVYTAAAFKSHLPHDVEEQIPDVSMIFDNVDRTLITDIRSVTGVPTVTMSYVLKSDPDTVEIGPLSFDIRLVRYDKMTVVGTLKYEDILTETYPVESYTPILYPGLYP